MSYEHTQQAPMGWLLMGAGIVSEGIGVVVGWPEPWAMIPLFAVAVALLLVAPMIGTLTARDEDSHLAVRFGTMPVFSRRIPYADIQHVEPGRSSWIDGWGIHYIIGHGMTYNIWGFECAKLTVRGRTVRIGTDDRENLVAFLRNKIDAGPASDALPTV